MKLGKILLFIFPAANAANEQQDDHKDFIEEIEKGHNGDKLLKRIIKFHSKEYQEEKADYLRSKDYQEKKEKYLKDNPARDVINGQFDSKLGKDDRMGSTHKDLQVESTNQCYTPVKYKDSGCCTQCSTFGCMVNKGIIDEHTPCDPLGTKTGIASWPFCSENGCKDADTCGDCWCEGLDHDHKFAVDSLLERKVLFYAFTTEWDVTNELCDDCGSKGDFNAKNKFMENKLNLGTCLSKFDGKSHNGMKCSQNSQCKSRRCSKFKCEDKLDNGFGCVQDDDCKSGRCTMSKCADKFDN